MTLPADRNAPPPWGILATIAWLLAAFLLSLLFAAAVYSVWQNAQPGRRPMTYDGVVIALGTLASVPVQVAVLSFAAQLRRWQPQHYLALVLPRRAEIVVAIVAVIVIDLGFDLMLYLTGRDIVPSFQVEAYQSAKDAGWLAALTLAIVVVAPVGEEIAFRGFLYRGLARAGRETLAIGAIAFIWALLHIQYDWLGMTQVFVIGLMLGWFRWAAGSTLLTIVMHMLINLEAMIETAIRVEWLT